MKLEMPKPQAESAEITSVGGGWTSPYADPPHAPVFVINFGCRGGRMVLNEDEAVNLHTQLSAWVDDLPPRKPPKGKWWGH